MQARAAAAQQTRERIVDAAVELFLTRWYDEVTLRDVASSSGVALQTVVNHFGSKDQLVAEAVDRLHARVEAQRGAATPDDLEGALSILVEHYELTGDAAIRALAMEERVPALHPVLDRGRRFHRAWVERIFASALARPATGPQHERALAARVAALDVYVWKLLRRDVGLSPAATAQVMHALVVGLDRPNRGWTP